MDYFIEHLLYRPPMGNPMVVSALQRGEYQSPLLLCGHPRLLYFIVIGIFLVPLDAEEAEVSIATDEIDIFCNHSNLGWPKKWLKHQKCRF